MLGALGFATVAHASFLVYVCGANLCRVNPDGSGQAQLTSDGQSGSASSYGSPSLSRDGTRLAFTFDYHVIVADANTSNRGSPFASSALVALMRPDGGAVAELEDTLGNPAIQVCTYSPGGGGRNCPYGTASAGWAPDGGLLISDSAGAPNYNTVIYHCPVAGSSNGCTDVRAADPANDLYDPSVSPDGSTLAVTVADGIGSAIIGHIALYDYATGQFERNLTSATDDQLPAWSPDGTQIAFQRASSIYVIDANGPAGSEHQLVAQGAQPTWGGTTTQSGGTGGNSGTGGTGGTGDTGGTGGTGGTTETSGTSGTSGTGSTGGPGAGTVVIRVPAQVDRVASNGHVTVRIACPGTARCSGTATLIATVPSAHRHRRHKLRLGSARFSIAARRSARVHIRLSVAGRRLLHRHHGRLPARLTVTYASGGHTRARSRAVRLVARPAHRHA